MTATSVTNVLQQVQVYNRAANAYLENLLVLANLANKKFKNFQNEIANLGSSTTFDLPPRFTYANGLVAAFQPAVQRVATLTCDQAINTSYGFTAQERIFNVEKDVDSYMNEFGKSSMMTMATGIEQNLALNAHSAVPVNSIVNGQTVPTGALHTESGPDRFYGDGNTPINSYQQLQQAVANFIAFGAANHDFKVVLPNTVVPAIIGTGLNQFAPRRNDEIARNWELGEFGHPLVDYYESNLLPVHISGNVGNSIQGGVVVPGANVLTVISTNDPTGANITQITCSGAYANDTNALLSGDMAYFVQNVAGQPNVKWLTFIGNAPTVLPTQIRVTTSSTGTNNVPADGSGHVIFNISRPLQATAGSNQNISSNIQAGMKLNFVPSHQCGILMSGNAFYMSMPRLPDQRPFYTSNEMSENGVSIRMTDGALFGQNFQGTTHDCTWGSNLLSDYCERLIFPLPTS